MLKRVFINSRKVPVPVPVRTLGEALRWVEATLVPVGHTITRVALDERVLGDAAGAAEREDLPLGDQSKLEIQIDSPVDLTIQTLDAMRNLASVIMGGLKVLAVECWQARSSAKPAELDAVSGDLELVLDLLDHVGGLVDPMHVDNAPIQGLQGMLKRAAVGLNMAKANSDWKACAKLLLNKLEPLLKELIAESETLQIRILTAGDGRIAPTGSTK
jgi:hypothetical protein